MKQQIDFTEFLEMEKKLDIRMGTIQSVERIPKSDKMLKLTVSFGETEKTVVTNIGDRVVDPEKTLQHLQFPFIMNLKPAKIMGVVSEAMIMVVENKSGNIEVITDGSFTDGSKLL